MFILALIAIAGTLFGPADFPFFRSLMAFLISSLHSFSQLISSSASAVWISGGSFEISLFRSCSKYSTHNYIFALSNSLILGKNKGSQHNTDTSISCVQNHIHNDAFIGDKMFLLYICQQIK